MAFYKCLNVVAFTSVLLLDLTASKVEACRCLPAGLYEGFEAADVVLHATALNMSEEVYINDDVTYTLDTITLYKEEPNETYAQEIDFTTSIYGYLCGVTLEIGEEYLIGLARHDTYHHLTANACGLVRVWSSVTDDEKASLEAGCEDDPCDETCGEFQECQYISFGSSGQYYCADVCDPSPCAQGETCILEEDLQCVHSPCPAIANCTASSD